VTEPLKVEILTDAGLKRLAKAALNRPDTPGNRVLRALIADEQLRRKEAKEADHGPV
jgi:hypothetical protein